MPPLLANVGVDAADEQRIGPGRQVAGTSQGDPCLVEDEAVVGVDWPGAGGNDVGVDDGRRVARDHRTCQIDGAGAAGAEPCDSAASVPAELPAIVELLMEIGLA